MQTVPLEHIQQWLRHRPGVVFGRSATASLSDHDDIFRAAKAAARITDYTVITDYYDLIDYLRAKAPETVDSVMFQIKESLEKRLTPSLSLIPLTSIDWCAAISLTPDLQFERAIQTRLERKPSGWNTSIIDHNSITLRGRTIPIYKLLGNLSDSRIEHGLAMGRSDLLLREQGWSRLLTTLVDFLKGGVLFFIGTESDIEICTRLLSVLCSGPPPHPHRLVFLKSDGTLSNATLVTILRSRFELVVVDSTLKEFCAFADAQAVQRNAPLVSEKYQKHENAWEQATRDCRDVISVAPKRVASSQLISADNFSITEALFRPASLDWAPYQLGLDFARSDASHLEKSIETMAVEWRAQLWPSVLLRGEAGVGKTCALKRVAVSLAEKGYKVLWWNRRGTEQARCSTRQLLSQFKNYFSKHSEKLSAEERSLIIFFDDPLALRVNPVDIIYAFEGHGIGATFVLSGRTTELVNAGSGGIELPTSLASEVELHYELDESELAALPQFLVSVAAEPDLESARKSVSAIPSKNSDDILCSLWYLLPQTRSQLEASIHDEYCRLGTTTNSVEAFAADASQGGLGTIARQAYENVAVTSNLDIGLPMEVLVRSLGVNYGDWLDMCNNGRPLWGLLYDESNEVTNDIVYWTRNEVVTKILLRLVNEGVGHAGEYRALTRLVATCSVGTPPYRSFLYDLLVKNRHRLRRLLNYDQGVELYKLAIDTFPEQDRALAHHFGIWIRDVGRDSVAAYSQFEKALETEDYPYAQMSEPQELIHTSMAAAVVSKIQDGTQDEKTGLEVIRGHLRQASTPRFFNPHTTHVFGNYLLEISKMSSHNNFDVSIESLSDGLRTIEQTLQRIGPSGSKSIRFSTTVTMLHELESKMLETLTDEDALTQYAREVFQTKGSQIGMEVVARRLLCAARNTRKGSDYNRAWNYIDECNGLVQGSGKELTINMRSLRADTLIRWRLSQPRGPIDWTTIRSDLELCLASPQFRDDVMKMYYYAVALFHLGEYGKAKGIFNQLHRITEGSGSRGGNRTYFSGGEGYPRRFQCEVKHAHSRDYVYIPELQMDVEVAGNFSSRIGAMAHCYIGFTLAGPRAVFTKPGDDSCALP